MTAQEKLHAVETAIRQELPRLMEPREGCWFHNEITLKKEKLILIDVNQNYVLLKQGGKKISVFTKEKTKKLLKIIGHDILISDVLEWLGRPKWDEMGKSNDYYVSDEGMLIRKNQDTSYDFLCEVNLSKPRLADQSGGLINLLHNLIKDN